MKSIFFHKPWVRLLIVAAFIFCATNAFTQPSLGNGYINLSKKTTGGAIQNGDTLEIRMSVHIPWGYNSGTIFRVRYYDNVPTNTTMLTGLTDSLRILTNEGITFSRYTLAAADDAGTYIAAPVAPEYQIRINLGGVPAAPANNTLASTSGAQNINVTSSGAGAQPKWWSGHLFSTGFRVRVTGAVGDTITLGTGLFVYRLTAGGIDQTISTTQYKIIISNDDTLCTDKIGSNFAGEFSGTFGNGIPLNRATAPSYLIPGYTYLNNVSPTQSVNDGTYAIVKNLSPYSSTNLNARSQPNCTTAPAVGPLDSCKYRMHGGYWYIAGDHTGTNNATGNPPPAAATDAGYMLMVNSDYVTNKAYEQTFSGLCSNTYYEFSAWVKNVCPNCGYTSNLVPTYMPGVKPNLTFAIDDIDRYNTGEMDTVGWMKKGFVFKTGPSQTSVTFSIRNNAQGGGGNDWVLDDISVATCTPNLNLTPSGNTNVCYGNVVNMSCLVSSYFNNYTQYQWQVSHNGGGSWTDTLAPGSGTPTLVGGNYQYTATFPGFLADSSQHLTMYRIRVATSGANLASSSCSFFNSVNIVVMVNSCSEILKTKIISFTGQAQHQKAILTWLADNENNNVSYEIERSDDGLNYHKIATVPYQLTNSARNTYQFTDTRLLDNYSYYRIKVVEGVNNYYTRTVLLSDKKEIAIRSLINPFTNYIKFEMYSPREMNATLVLMDNFGRIILQKKQNMFAGNNVVLINELDRLSTGGYTLQVMANGEEINKRIIKVVNNK